MCSFRIGRGLAIDVAVVCPVAPSHLDQKEPCEYYGLYNKHERYDEGFKNSNCQFVPLIFETSGAINEEGALLLKQLIRFASKSSRVPLGLRWSRLGRLQCSLQSVVAQMILNRSYDPLSEH